MKQGISNVVLCRIQKKNFILHFHCVLFTGRSTCISRKQYPYKKGGDRNTKQDTTKPKTMLKKIAFYLTGISLALACACTREMPHEKTDKEQKPVESTAEWIEWNNAKGGIVVQIGTRIGHTEENCDGSCTKDGRFHKDCQGTGKECLTLGSLKMEPIIKSTLSNQAHTALCLYPEDISDCETFSMPDRSFKIKNEEQWLNIPKQILERDKGTHCFIIKSITFTEKPLYTNL